MDASDTYNVQREFAGLRIQTPFQTGMALLAHTCLANCLLLLLPLFAVVFAAADIDAYGSGFGLEKPKLRGDRSFLSTNIGIQGVIYCRSGSRLIPLRGARARVTCLAVDGRGYETAPFCIVSRLTDANGYFLATLSPSEVEDNWKLTQCKAFLESSPSETCKVPTDVNRGVTGALLSSRHLPSNKRMEWFSVGPFVYTS
ncbi:protein SEED AND ROOT HAIR PROTECTIVE PROTEIN-like [Rhodamnia argentea]|uniref:Protein SEED AND ROOT HAIR PROTECTIVE PROTEIN-like n=1 Tax=Rhodamnia argentea TaxID=178133 RepID=A0A8B8PCS9_9MYRT|nr:protein SEED AND ROOT HAIR PROTECTIVE PROTEIN-like [Rhodamnia argentea]